jgi:MYXO-CTERM domain-containing protein
MVCFRNCVAILFVLLMATSVVSAQTSGVNSDGTTFVYTGQINIPDNGSSLDPGAPWGSLPQNGTLTLTPGWHDIELRFGTPADSVGTFRALVPGTSATNNTGSSETQVPEPALIGLAGFGALALIRRARRC